MTVMLMTSFVDNLLLVNIFRCWWLIFDVGAQFGWLVISVILVVYKFSLKVPAKKRSNSRSNLKVKRQDQLQMKFDLVFDLKIWRWTWPLLRGCLKAQLIYYSCYMTENFVKIRWVKLSNELSWSRELKRTIAQRLFLERCDVGIMIQSDLFANIR